MLRGGARKEEIEERRAVEKMPDYLRSRLYAPSIIVPINPSLP